MLAFGAFGALIAVVAGVVRWMTTTWAVSDAVIRYRTGVVSRKETDIPLSRVQAVDTVYGPLQRLFGVRGVTCSPRAAGAGARSGCPRWRRATSRRCARRSTGAAASPRPPAPLAEWRLGGRDLLLAALTAGQLGFIVPLLAAVPQLSQEVFGNDIRTAGEEGLRLVPDTTLEWIGAAAALLALAWIVSIAGAVLTFAGFAVARDEQRLRLRRGLFARREATIPVARVQAVQLVEGVLRQPFGLAALRVEVAGYAAEHAAARTLFPLLRRADADAFLAALLPELAGTAPHVAGARLAPAPRRALRRYVLPPAAAALVLGAIAAVAIPGAGALAAARRRARRGVGRRVLAGGRLAARRRARPAALPPDGADHRARAGGAAPAARAAPDRAATARAARRRHRAGRRRHARARPPPRRRRRGRHLRRAT